MARRWRGFCSGEDGAFVTFEGVTRNNSKGRATRYLDYECYEPMAMKTMAEIGRDIATKFAMTASRWCTGWGAWKSARPAWWFVTAPHRRPAFEAALEGINRLKRLVPVWKKEYFADGEVWVDGEWERVVGRREGPS